MGRMKNVFMQMQEEAPDADPAEYLKQYTESLRTTDILCPNCTKHMLIQESAVDLFCKGCAEKYTKTGDKQVKYKQ